MVTLQPLREEKYLLSIPHSWQLIRRQTQRITHVGMPKSYASPLKTKHTKISLSQKQSPILKNSVYLFKWDLKNIKQIFQKVSEILFRQTARLEDRYLALRNVQSVHNFETLMICVKFSNIKIVLELVCKQEKDIERQYLCSYLKFKDVWTWLWTFVTFELGEKVNEWFTKHFIIISI